MDEVDALRAELTSTKENIEAVGATFVELGGKAGSDEYPQDTERDVCVGRVAVLSQKSEDLKTKLKRVKNGEDPTKCVKCDETIDPERRTACPETNLCVSCKQEEERTRKRLG